ncbi:hypothetical protein KP509_26G063900 [Ceratopteris richardii]|uniref:Uncharacterized protein n=1 Tax=Ceratopteris richardii TaxID=49495 RepID=A0A8T2RNM8_CERRI|nr:hypothetical protein KP509_26G063900 [Ceratopteris richardii]
MSVDFAHSDLEKNHGSDNVGIFSLVYEKALLLMATMNEFVLFHSFLYGYIWMRAHKKNSSFFFSYCFEVGLQPTLSIGSNFDRTMHTLRGPLYRSQAGVHVRPICRY